MSDSDMLKLAAKAGGIGPVYCYEKRRNCLRIGNKESYAIWNPLSDDGDAMRLAVRCRLDVLTDDGDGKVGCLLPEADYVWQDIELCIFASTRRAIVRAAAEIGLSMP